MVVNRSSAQRTILDRFSNKRTIYSSLVDAVSFFSLDFCVGAGPTGWPGVLADSRAAAAISAAVSAAAVAAAPLDVFFLQLLLLFLLRLLLLISPVLACLLLLLLVLTGISLLIWPLDSLLLLWSLLLLLRFAAATAGCCNPTAPTAGCGRFGSGGSREWRPLRTRFQQPPAGGLAHPLRTAVAGKARHIVRFNRLFACVEAHWLKLHRTWLRLHSVWLSLRRFICTTYSLRALPAATPSGHGGILLSL